MKMLGVGVHSIECSLEFNVLVFFAENKTEMNADRSL